MAVSTEELGESKNKLYKNVSSDQIQITVDKLILKLERFQKSNKRSTDWCTWLGIFITTTASLNAATFSETLGIDGSTWKVIFILIAVCSFIMLLISPLRYFWNRMTIEGFIDECKKSE